MVFLIFLILFSSSQTEAHAQLNTDFVIGKNVKKLYISRNLKTSKTRGQRC